MANKPEKSFYLGGVSAAIFINEGQQGSFRSIRLSRRYRDEGGNWRSSDSFTATQAASAAAVLQQAIGYVMEQEEQRAEEPAQED